MVQIWVLAPAYPHTPQGHTCLRRQDTGYCFWFLNLCVRTNDATYDILTHPGLSDDDLLDLYRDSGFDTDLILQNPFTHLGPSAACVVGFPLSLPISPILTIQF